MSKVFIVFNNENPNIISYTNDIINYITSMCVDVYVDVFDKKFIKAPNCNFCEFEKNAFDFILTIGGDGTFIKGSELSILKDVPIFGINMGRLGFLATVDKQDKNKVVKILNGEYKLSKHMLLNADVYSNGCVKSYTCINDVVIAKNVISKIAYLDVYYNEDNLLNSYRCDGIIIATPVGSTAYALSAGGSIIDPKLEVINMVPICSHSTFDKSIVFNSDMQIKLSINKINATDIYLSIDGKWTQKIEKDDFIVIKKSDKYLNFVESLDNDYYKTLYDKFINKGFN